MPNKKVPKPASALKKNRFEFDLDIDGETRTFSIPKLGFINRKVKKAMRLLPPPPQRSEDESDAVYAAKMDNFYDSVVEILVLADPSLEPYADDLDNEQIDWIVEAWQKESGVEVGESQTSSS